MSRIPPTSNTVKRLFALSGNECAYPNCNTRIVDEETEIVVGEICHIEAAEQGGPRFNPSQTDEERRRFENLILLCANHHRITDARKFKVEDLFEMKLAHESRFRSFEYVASDKVIAESIRRMKWPLPNAASIGVFNLLKTAYSPRHIAISDGSVCHFRADFGTHDRDHSPGIFVECLHDFASCFDRHFRALSEPSFRHPVFSRMLAGQFSEAHLFLMVEYYSRTTDFAPSDWELVNATQIKRDIEIVAQAVLEINELRRMPEIKIVFAAFDRFGAVFVPFQNLAHEPRLCRTPFHELLVDQALQERYAEACRQQYASRHSR